MDVNNIILSVKNYLDITWNDKATDEKIKGIIQRGMRYLNRTAGAELDYSVEGQARELLFDYCRYVRDNALDEFQKNYRHELLSLQNAEEIKAYEEENSEL